MLWLPNLLWQADNGWPTLAMSAALREKHSGAGYTITFLVLQFVLPGPWAAPVWLGGLWALLRERRFRPYRTFAVAYLLLFVVIMVAMGDRPYYLAPLYVVLFGAGSVVAAGVVAGSRRFFSERPPSRRLLWRSPAAAFVWVSAFALVLLPVSLPLLPASWLATLPLQKVNYNMGEEIGWQDLARTVAGVYDGLPAKERAHTVILTGNYGEAGALQRYGEALGLPAVYSGQNNFHLWGAPPKDATTVIVVGFRDREYATPYFEEVERAATISNRPGVDNEEAGLPVWVARGLKRPWADMWPDLQHYD